MAFEGYREEHRGNWFGGGTNMIYVSESTFQERKEPEIYIINEQDFDLIRIRDEQQLKMMRNCMFGPQLQLEEIDWLKGQGGFTYFNSVDEYIDKKKQELDELMR
ncbi:hypothetical protein [Saccharibacillus sacchari]|uniref:hypothetical protein n=1 Tax=Saccharibacillus sacchari TaxID=456493 RepID=UPI00055BF4FE|nr:hypothetical protein [Saccharibacillus sacchari]